MTNLAWLDLTRLGGPWSGGAARDRPGRGFAFADKPSPKPSKPINDEPVKNPPVPLRPLPRPPAPPQKPTGRQI